MDGTTATPTAGLPLGESLLDATPTRRGRHADRTRGLLQLPRRSRGRHYGTAPGTGQ